MRSLIGVCGVLLAMTSTSWACERSCAAGTPRDAKGCCIKPDIGLKIPPQKVAKKPTLDWVRLPAGRFEMGPPGEAKAVRVAGFELAKSEVTVAQYRRCVRAGACEAPSEVSNYGQKGYDAHPVTDVTWASARGFCAWIGARLPSEAEWEYAARGGQNVQYPWGNAAPTCKHAMMDAGGEGCGLKGTAPVCSKPLGHSKHGLCDMSGNVWEWVEDLESSQAGAPIDGMDQSPQRVMRGGSWKSGPKGLSATGGTTGPEAMRDHDLGFRCSRSRP